MLRPFPDLFVRREGHANIAVRNVFRLQRRQRGHYLGNTGLVIGAKQRFAIGGDQRLPEQLVQDREHHRGEHFIANPESDITATVVFNDLRVYVFAAEVRRRVDVGNKANGRNSAGNVGRKGSHHRPFLT